MLEPDKVCHKTEYVHGENRPADWKTDGQPDRKTERKKAKQTHGIIIKSYILYAIISVCMLSVVSGTTFVVVIQISYGNSFQE